MQPLTLKHIVHRVRNRIENAISNNDRRLLAEIAVAMTLILEASEDRDNKELNNILEVLRYVAKEGSMSFYRQDLLPNHEVIDRIFE